MTKILQNFFKTTVSVAWGTGTGNLYIATKPTSNTAGWLVVSPNSASLREIVAYSGTGTDGTGDYIVCTARGVGGTTAQIHAIAEPVRMNITAEHWADIFVSPTFTGTVTVPTPVATTDAATKAYVDGVAIAGGADASTTVKGISKLSTAPASATNPIAVGDNDPRVPTQTENDTLGAIVAGTDFYAASAVGTDSYAITISPAITAYTTGMKFRFKADVANTGACTLAVSGLSALAIKKLNDQDTATGDIEAGQIVEVVYDGTDFQMQSQIAQEPSYTKRITTFTTNVTLASSVVETTVLSVSIPGGSLSTLNALRGKIYFDDGGAVAGLGLTSTKTATIRLKYGATTLVTQVLTNSTGGALAANGSIEFALFAAGATNAQEGVVQPHLTNGSPTFQASGYTVNWATVGSSAEDSTADKTLALTIQFNNSSAADTFTAVNGYVELIK